MSAPPGVSWVFGYGSLMWNPGFPYVEQTPADLIGYHRAFCMYSHRHRGTKEQPGLVLGLDRGGRCPGVAFRVAGEDWADTVAALNERELAGYAYAPAALEVVTPQGPVRALTYVADPDHPNYAGGLPMDEAVRIILAARGIGGRNRDYVAELVRKLEALGCEDAQLRTLMARVQQAA